MWVKTAHYSRSRNNKSLNMLFYVTFEITAISDLHLASEFTDWQNRGKLKGHLSCVCVCVCVHAHARTILNCLLTWVQFFVTLWTVSHPSPLSMEFSRQEYWSKLPFSPPGHPSELGIEPVSPALSGRFFTTVSHGKPRQSFLSCCQIQSEAICYSEDLVCC